MEITIVRNWHYLVLIEQVFITNSQVYTGLDTYYSETWLQNW